MTDDLENSLSASLNFLFLLSALLLVFLQSKNGVIELKLELSLSLSKGFTPS